ncbi:CobW family GTP-binding protein [Psychrobacillus psychrodurans]|uniref:CobW family GTP-binding protein n=1 Tax=Psychrobacillus psychrodurans TaxID=126157 RepID=UPI0008E4C370|nr:GTP-binding protein [Psychrobacillus psychrodurans]MCZ8539933.1 GTP-binding protein [Psychrobacillus psychrodurans]SFM53959.1 GTPase, G3E family [Psychrobacillus psychrodurans]
MKDVYLLSGFLGSGKTSLLSHLIEQLKAEGLKPAVIMNELGKLPFDSKSVDEDVPIKEMLEGCICCTGAEKMEAQLQMLLEGEEFDVLLIETTGAAHPVEAMDAVLSPYFASRLNMKGIITVADCKRWIDRDKMTPQTRMLFMEQIKHAHLIVANKVDLLSDNEIALVTLQIQGLNSHAPIIQTSNAKLPLKMITNLEATYFSQEIQQAAIGKQLSLSSRLHTFTEPVNKDEFEKWVKELPDTIYRMKGYVPLKGHKNPFLFQYAYGMVQWLPEYIKMHPQIVIIGDQVESITIIGSAQND